ncbi:MAG: T9SS type A sorting domain-containing protein [Ignavibacteria bacterium]|nr:T9SS type A sorting domain-containing protein [Ignavibacteria bacterium]
MIKHLSVIFFAVIIHFSSTVNSYSQLFQKIDLDLEGLSGGNVQWIDLNNDMLLDIFLTGRNDSGLPATFVYINQGNENFVKIISGIPDVSSASVDWEDFDKDGDIDLLLSGVSGNGSLISGIYRNDLPSGFTAIDFDLIKIYSGSVKWIDYNNDADADVFITGSNSEGVPESKLYKNIGGGFAEVNTSFHSLYNSTYEFFDLDNDGDRDVIFTGQSDESKTSYVTKIFINDNGTFSESGNSIQPVSKGSASWGDFDADGFADIVINGETNSSGYGMMIMHNNHDGTFTQHSSQIPGIAFGKVLWADFDNDGLLDILMAGNLQGNTNGITKLFRNSNGIFQEVSTDFPALINSIVSAGDYNNDSKLDIIINGHDHVSGKNITALYKNLISISNDLPVEPKGLTTSFDRGIIHFNWLSGYDQNTPSPGLTYNIRIGTTPGGSEIISPLSSGSSGFNKFPGHGNSGNSLQTHLTDLDTGKYYWSVQTVDNTYNTSEFSIEQSFIVTKPGELGIPVPQDIVLKQNFPNPFNPKTIISYRISKFKKISLRVYNTRGEEIATLIDKDQNSGSYEIEFDGSGYSSGIYFYSLEADGEFVESKRMILIK